MSETSLPNPSAGQKPPGFPSDYQIWTMEGFAGLNTKPPRPGIEDKETSWCDGWMPIGPNQLRTLYDVGTAVYTASGARITWCQSGNIGNTFYIVALLSNGSVIAIPNATGSAVTILAAGTILSPSYYMGFSQWGSQYLIFAKDQDNGYWLWDGTNTYTAGTVGPVVTLTGSGLNFTSTPTVFPYGGSGSGDSYSVTLDNTSISQVLVTNPGSGFQIGDVRGLQFSSSVSRTAIAVADLSAAHSNGCVVSITVNNGGAGFGTVPTLLIDPPPAGGNQAYAHVSSIAGGTITGITIDAPGFGYTSIPNVTISGGTPGAGYIAPTLTVNIANGVLHLINMLDHGLGYTEAPTVVIMGDSTGTQAVANFANGMVQNITVTNFGTGGYTKATIILEGGGNNVASGYVQIMPFGVSGTTVETFQTRAWVSNGSASATFPPLSRTIFSAPGSPVDFGDGGGAFSSSDSFTKVGYFSLKQSNGFLYFIADSSVNYASGVTTSGTPATTTFSFQNVDPNLGSRWPNSVQVFNRNILFANRQGIYISYGGAVTKISDPLDGFYNSVPNPASVINPSAAVANIFGIQVFMLLMPVIDQYTSQQVNKLLMWDGKKWWTSQQGVKLTQVFTQEINSVMTAYGTDGTSIYPLFQTPSNNFNKVVQSKLWSKPHYIYRKTAMALQGIVYFYQAATGYVPADEGDLIVNIDNEFPTGSTSAMVDLPLDQMHWSSGVANPLLWDIVWFVPGLVVFGPNSAGPQAGRLIGLTAQTTSPDCAIVSLSVTGQAREART